MSPSVAPTAAAAAHTVTDRPSRGRSETASGQVGTRTALINTEHRCRGVALHARFATHGQTHGAGTV